MNSSDHTYSFFLYIFLLLASASSIHFFVIFFEPFSLFSFFCIASFKFEDEGASGYNMHDGDQSSDRCDPTPFPVVLYIERDSDRLDDYCFSVMHLAGDVCEICDVRTRLIGDSAASVWIKQRRQWDGKGGTYSLCHLYQMTSPYFCCVEKVG